MCSQNANILHLQFHIPRFMALHNNVRKAPNGRIFATCVQSTCSLHYCCFEESAQEVLRTTAARQLVLKVYLQLNTINLANKVDQHTKMVKQEQHYLQVKHTRAINILLTYCVLFLCGESVAFMKIEVFVMLVVVVAYGNSL